MPNDSDSDGEDEDDDGVGGDEGGGDEDSAASPLVGDWEAMEEAAEEEHPGEEEEGGFPVVVAVQASGVEIDEGADLPDYVPTEADWRLDEVLGDHIHDNDGSHLDGGISDDALWQARHRLLTAFPSRQYAPPSCRVGKNIIAQFRHELEGSCLHK